MYERILVPTDGSDTAMVATEWAISFARQFDVTLHVVFVVEHGDLPAVGGLAERGENAVKQADDLATDAGVSIRTKVIESSEPTHRKITDYARNHDIDAIVLGTHGRTGLDRLFLGSIAERTLRTATVPVITIHGNVDVDARIDHVLVPTDGSVGALAAADHAIELALATGATLHTINVVNIAGAWSDFDLGIVYDALEDAGQQAVDEVAERARKAGVQTVETEVQAGTPSRTIIEYTNGHGIDCVVMGTHGRAGLDRLLLGSVAERVVKLADVPVIGVKSQEVIERIHAE